MNNTIFIVGVMIIVFGLIRLVRHVEKQALDRIDREYSDNEPSYLNQPFPDYRSQLKPSKGSSGITGNDGFNDGLSGSDSSKPGVNDNSNNEAG